MFEYQRTQAWIESVKTTVTNAKTRFAVTVTHDNIEVTVTVEDKKNLETSLDLNNIKQLVSDYITTTDNTDFDSVINTIYLMVAQHYPKRDIEVLIYDNVECLSIMKIFNFNQPAI
jgi:hypothetical protein